MKAEDSSVGALSTAASDPDQGATRRIKKPMKAAFSMSEATFSVAQTICLV
jgi:hypothetical protein